MTLAPKEQRILLVYLLMHAACRHATHSQLSRLEKEVLPKFDGYEAGTIEDEEIRSLVNDIMGRELIPQE